MKKKLGVLMDPIDRITPYKDTTLAMMLEAKRRGWDVFYLTPQAIWLQDGLVWGNLQKITVYDDQQRWFTIENSQHQPLTDLDCLLMRKDPPFNMDYIYLTYLLELAQAKGLLVLNHPASLRDANEKLFAAWFAACCPKTLVTSQADLLKKFIMREGDTVIKPLSGMGGHSVFRVLHNDPNLNVIIETVTENGQALVMAQRFIEEIADGDKRIILINGEPIPYALARVPAKDDFRGNLAAGARGEGRELTERDLWLCEQVGPTLRDKGLIFVGLDVIGDYITEINVTSPTGVRELDRQFNLNICQDLFDYIDDELAT